MALPHQRPYGQTASSFCLRQCGVKSTVSDRRNPADLHTLTLSNREPPPACGAALVARRAAIYGIQSASFRTSGKEIVTWFGMGALNVCVGVLVSACAVLQQDPRDLSHRVLLEETLQALVDGVVEQNRTIPGTILHVETPRLGFSWSHAAGVVDRERGIPLTPQHPVRLASNMKTFVAAAILRLWEEGRLALDASLVDHLSSDFLQVLARDGYQPVAITIRHLLTHTSGLFDYGDSPAFGQKIEADPTHRWTRAEQLQSAMDWGEPYGPPGQVYRYSDTGYILLGDIVERTSGQPLAAALRELLEDAQLGLASTWLETLEPPPAGAKERAHQYLGDVDPTAGTRPSTCMAAVDWSARWATWHGSSAASLRVASTSAQPRARRCSRPSWPREAAPQPTARGRSQASTGWGLKCTRSTA
jgi:CubicO group peptidase (beta-lactamase class C family)